MRLEGIQTGDIIEVDHNGRRFHAIVTAPAPGGLAVAPLDRRVNHYSARSSAIGPSGEGHARAASRCARPLANWRSTSPAPPSARRPEAVVQAAWLER